MIEAPQSRPLALRPRSGISAVRPPASGSFYWFSEFTIRLPIVRFRSTNVLDTDRMIELNYPSEDE
jgi:hypothetical protein